MYNPNLHFHFTGIGGSGMSGLAEILIESGFKVSGSDQKWSAACERLSKRGAQIFIGHAPEHLPASASLLVFSSAVSDSNPEIVEAKTRGMPIIRRAEVLAELMRLRFGVGVAGSHGKTSTTSMLAAIMEAGELDPTVVIGGIVRSMGTGGKLGKSDYLVAEADESDRSFLLLTPTIAVVTNIDAEHLTSYSSMKELEESFGQFVRSVPFYGLAVLCADDPRVRQLADEYHGRKVLYGLSPSASLRAENIIHTPEGMEFDVLRDDQLVFHAFLPMLGRHFLVNSLAAIAVGLEFGIPAEKIDRALRGFSGVKRRIEHVGDAFGTAVIDDYGHHPTEVRATISAVRAAYQRSLGRVHVVFQPHRFSRTRDCFVEFLDAFNDADTVTITDIYPAGEEPIEGISGEKLCSALSHKSARHIPDLDSVMSILPGELEAGDVVLCLGAGSISGFAEKLLQSISSKGIGKAA